MEPISRSSSATLVTTAAITPALDFFEDPEFMIQGLLQLSTPCATITISNKHVLKKAAKKLGVSIHGYNFTCLGGEDIVASVTMDVPPHRENPFIKKREFYGEWTMFRNKAKESACLAALTYLKDAGLIVVHDHNFADMNKYKRKFEEEHFWSSICYDCAVTEPSTSDPAKVGRQAKLQCQARRSLFSE